MSRQLFVLSHAQARQNALQAVRAAGEGWVVEIKPPTRTLDQNARMWAMLIDISEQVVWHGRKLDAENWKHVFTSSLKQLDVVPNLENTGFVALGMSTSKMNRREMGELMELMQAFAEERGVRFSAGGRP